MLLSRLRVPGAFLSTPSVWRVTSLFYQLVNVLGISIHTLRVEGDTPDTDTSVCHMISIHTLRVEGDDCLGNWANAIRISIHTLRVEGDSRSRP